MPLITNETVAGNHSPQGNPRALRNPSPPAAQTSPLARPHAPYVPGVERVGAGTESKLLLAGAPRGLALIEVSSKVRQKSKNGY